MANIKRAREALTANNALAEAALDFCLHNSGFIAWKYWTREAEKANESAEQLLRHEPLPRDALKREIKLYDHAMNEINRAKAIMEQGEDFTNLQTVWHQTTRDHATFQEYLDTLT